MIDKKDYSLLEHNTFGIDASCRRFLEYASIEEARLVAEIVRSSNDPYLIIGGGSNLLLTKDYAGVVVHSAIKGIEAEEQADGTVMLTCGSGEVWDDVVAYSVERGWYGAENLSIIPGEVGASAVQNIGAYGAEVCQIIDKIEAVEIATGDIRIFDVKECGYGYRQSRFKKNGRTVT